MWYPKESSETFPHHSLSCNAINGTQMIIMGGTFPESDMYDTPAVLGQHGLNLGENNPTGSEWMAFVPDFSNIKVRYLKRSSMSLAASKSTSFVSVLDANY
jgi:hypothetical protein